MLSLQDRRLAIHRACSSGLQERSCAMCCMQLPQAASLVAAEVIEDALGYLSSTPQSALDSILDTEDTSAGVPGRCDSVQQALGMS